MIDMQLDKGLRLCGLKIVVVLLMRSESYDCIYRVYMSDGAFYDYIGFDAVPDSVKDWMKARNTWEFVIPSAMVISGVGVV